MLAVEALPQRLDIVAGSSMTEASGSPESAAAGRSAPAGAGCSPAQQQVASPGATAELMTQSTRKTASVLKRRARAGDAPLEGECLDREDDQDVKRAKRDKDVEESAAVQATSSSSPGQPDEAQQQQQPDHGQGSTGAGAAPAGSRGKSMLEVVFSPLLQVFGRNQAAPAHPPSLTAPSEAPVAAPASEAVPTAAASIEESGARQESAPAAEGADLASASASSVATRTHHAHHPPPPEVPEAAESEVDPDEVDDGYELEFDPLLFIRSLPPLEQCVPRHRATLLPRKTRQCKRKTLVLDLDETLVHSSVEVLSPGAPPPDFTLHVSVNHICHTIHVRRRPHLEEFMTAVASMFEVVVFTASQKPYAEQLLNVIDPKRTLVKHRVFRDSCVMVDGNYLKDLTVLGRDMATTFIIDNSPHAFGFQPDNGIPIESWFDDPSDTELLKLLPFLKRLASDDIDDVRPLIASKFRLKELIARLPPDV